ncbi:MAG: lysophospholipid acyltransferase family protein [Tissierellia bacterium]|nr:lysophospholipid acyltransferase family protein [Tissierellia bacterium]
MLYRVLFAVLRPIARVLYGLRPGEVPQIPEGEAAMIVANHANFLDPVLVSLVLPRQIHWVAKEELFHIPLFGGFIRRLGAIPIRRDSGDVKSLKAIMKVARGGKIVGIFPEGTRMKGVDLDRAKPQTLTLASRLHLPVYPVSIRGPYRIFSKMEVIFHSPITFEKKVTGDEAQELMREIMREIYSQVYPEGHPDLEPGAAISTDKLENKELEKEREDGNHHQ